MSAFAVPSWPSIGRAAFLAAFAVAFVSAYVRVWRGIAADPQTRTQTQHLLRRAFLPTCLILAAQVAILATGRFFPDLRSAGGIAQFYFICALQIPVLWAAGQLDQETLNWPKRPAPVRSRKIAVLGAVHIAGLAVSYAVFRLGHVEPGASVRQMSSNAGSQAGLILTGIWLLINAPWIEELVFRHWLLAWLVRIAGSSRTGIIFGLILTTAIFAIGHSAHTVPAWPKLIQMAAWGFSLGAIRIYYGTLWAIALHLAWNLSTPLLATILW